MNEPLSEQEARTADEILSKYARELTEHFDTVHIFVTRYDQVKTGGTFGMDSGMGNFYARYGQISEWLEKQRARICFQANRQIEE